VTDNPRIEELRRRVQKDPASIAFAQLAEEYRRSGSYEDAVRVCRTGLAKHPSYLSARVTLGRALIELAQFEDAQTELDYVLRSAPENLAAIRGLAEIHQRRGELPEALKHYQAALAIAKHDPELEESVHELSRQLGTDPGIPLPASQPVVTPPPIPLDIEETAAAFDVAAFTPAPETVVVPPPPAAPALSAELEAAADEFTRALEALDTLNIDLPTPPLPEQSFALPDLKALDQPAPETSIADQLGLPEPTAPVNAQADAAALSDLENWLASIDSDRNLRNS